MNENELEITKENMYNWLVFMLAILDEENDFHKQITSLVKKYCKEEFDLEINPLNRD
jgi:hypothetical protein